MEIFQQRLKEQRLARGLSQKQLAELLDTTNSSVCDWERGRTEPDGDALLKLAECLNVSTDYLLGRTDEFGSVVTAGALQLTDPERELLLRYRQLRPDLQELLLSTAKTWAETPVDRIQKKA